MNKNIFDNLEVFNPEPEKIVAPKTTVTKKEQTQRTQELREAYGANVEKPNQKNPQGSKTYKSNKGTKQPHHEIDQQKRMKKHHGANEVQREMHAEIEEMEKEQETVESAPAVQIKSVNQYFKDQGVEISIPEGVKKEQQSQRKRVLNIPAEFQKKIDLKKKGYPKKKLNDKDDKEFPAL